MARYTIHTIMGRFKKRKPTKAALQTAVTDIISYKLVNDMRRFSADTPKEFEIWQLITREMEKEIKSNIKLNRDYQKKVKTFKKMRQNRSSIQKTGEIWEECPHCGREPVFMPLMVCEKCWDKEADRQSRGVY